MGRIGPTKLRVPPDDSTPFYSDHFVWMHRDRFAEIDAADRSVGGILDRSCYGWGHAGPLYYAGRIVIVGETLGM